MPYPTKTHEDFVRDHGAPMGTWMFARRLTAKGNRAFNAGLPWNRWHKIIRGWERENVPTGPELRDLFIRDKAWEHEHPMLETISSSWVGGKWVTDNLHWVAGNGRSGRNGTTRTIVMSADWSPTTTQ